MALNWPGLLAWSTKYHDGTAPSEFKKMSDEDREFLERAMEEAFGQIEDPNKVMQEAVGMITAEDRTEETIMTALEVLDRCCDDPDCSRNADKLGAIQALLDLLEPYPGQIRLRALEFLALIFSNNPIMQKAGADKGGMELLLGLVRGADQGSEDRMKSFRTLVSMTRNVEEYETKLLRELGGSAVIVACMDPEEDSKTREKSVSFVRSLVANGIVSSEEVAQFADSLQQLFNSTLGDESIQYRETLAGTAVELALSDPDCCASSGLADAAKARLEAASAQADEDVAGELEALTSLAESLRSQAASEPAPAAAPAA